MPPLRPGFHTTGAYPSAEDSERAPKPSGEISNELRVEIRGEPHPECVWGPANEPCHPCGQPLRCVSKRQRMNVDPVAIDSPPCHGVPVVKHARIGDGTHRKPPTQSENRELLPSLGRVRLRRSNGRGWSRCDRRARSRPLRGTRRRRYRERGPRRSRRDRRQPARRLIAVTVNGLGSDLARRLQPHGINACFSSAIQVFSFGFSIWKLPPSSQTHHPMARFSDSSRTARR